ncbi:MAG: hypothetical protein CVT49_07115 [candidate division Zixibacteria bacterium HGW-Zixibacteria-1]|nr:MAG: hypothetical protein CVT49_07115 [candidate division Zixibacteria bacterium HGW-Zixibacteria-1]
MKKDKISADRKGRGEISAEKILIAARAEFARHGLAGARVDRIAAKSGVNKAMIYYHFGSKEKLYQEVIKAVVSNIAAFLGKASAESRDPMEMLEKIASFYQDMFYRSGDFRAIFLRELAVGGGRLKEAFATVFSEQEVHKKMKAIIDQGKKSGLFRDVDSTHAIISFMGMNIFYFIASPIVNQMWEIKNEERFLQKRKKEVPDLFLHGLLAK